MYTIESLSDTALPLANDKGQAEIESELKKHEAHLAECKTRVPVAKERKAMLQRRLAELNAAQPLQQANYKSATIALVDEYVLGCPPLDESASQHAMLDAARRFLDLSIQRTAAYHLPLAQREILVAELDVARARESVVDYKALKSMAERLRLIKPIIQHEGSLEVAGGVTELLLQRSKEAFLETRRLEKTLQEFDEHLSQMWTRLSV
jgi:CHASE3 domain sensor protein